LTAVLFYEILSVEKKTCMTLKEATRLAAKELGIQIVTRMNKGKLAKRTKEILAAAQTRI
jgi:hypothetical protein